MTRRDEADEPLISTPHDRRNGRKWWQETWGKAIGTVLGGVLLGVVWWTWGVAIAFKAATVEVYSLPPVVGSHEMRLHAIEARVSQPMPQSEVDRMAQAIAAALAKQQRVKP